MRLVAVLGYSGFRGRGLHAICLTRLRHAEALARDDDTVLLSGEAQLMRDASSRSDLVLGAARNTRENAVGVAAAARELGADEVVVVTSSWHARRARTLVRAAVGHDVAVTGSSPPGRPPLRLALRELACLTVLPFHARALARGRELREQRVSGAPVRGARGG
jgi:uncharacterized SAM-binding protein YcdF (DUF218 family)